jgi:hypothetical protein
MIAIVSSIAALLHQCIDKAMRTVRLSAPLAPLFNRPGCNRSATTADRRVAHTSCRFSLLFPLAVSAIWPAAAHAQSEEPAVEAVAPQENRASAVMSFLGGAVAGLAAHEGGHLLFDAMFDAHPGVDGVSFGGIPFFAITHTPVSPRQEYTIAAAGFWVQNATSEWLLVRRPNLRHERAPFAKGLLAWNVLASVAYGGAAFARAGPPERDTRGMAQALGVPEPWVGALVIAPALLDTVRYVRPDSRWARWTSRGSKIALVVLVAAAGR